MANLLYRVSTTPPTPSSTSVNSGALTSTQIDGNFKSLNDELITKAPLASPTLTGTPVAPTAAVSTNTTQLATTAFVVAQIGNDAPTKSGTGATGTWSIGISGNASTVTNGVYTSGSYSDPAWITSLAGSKVTNAVLTTGTYSNPSWITALSETKVLPTQTNNSGKFLTTNGTVSSWVTIDAFPSQTGNSGKFLTTNGSVVSWTTVDKSSIGLGNVENTALSTWVGSTNITTIGAATATSLTINGDLVVNGTTTTINTNNLSIDDKNIELGSVSSISNVSGTVSGTATTTTVTGITSTSGMIPGQTLTRVSGTGAFGGTTTITSVDSATQITITSTTANTAGALIFNVGGATDATATGGGITLKGATDKTIIWDSNGWTHSENVNVASGKSYKINGTDVLTSTTLGSGVVNSSLISVGTIATGTWQGTDVGLAYGGTNATLTAVNGGVVYSTASAMAISSAGTTGQYLTSNGAAAPEWTTLTKSTIGLGNVENTALSTWAGTTNITTIGAATATSLSTGNLTVTGDLVVNGTTTTINTNSLTVDDKNIELGSVGALTGITGTISSTSTTTTVTGITSTVGMIPGQAVTRVSGAGAFGGATTITSVDSATQITITSTTANTTGSVTFNVGGATDATATGGGITLKGATDKTITWDATNGWSSTETFNIASGKTYKINGTDVLSSTTLGSNVTGSSLTSVGTISTGTWSASFGAVSGANLTNLTAGNLSGTIPSDVLGNSTVYVGTTAVALNRATANLALTGISSVTLPGSTSGSVQIIPAATAGTGTVLTLPATSGTVITSGDTSTVTNAMLAGSIATSKITGLATSATTDTTNASNISSGTLGSARLPSIYIGNTTAQFTSANQALTGISSVTLPGSTSGSVQIIPAATAGTGTVLTLPATTGTVVTTGDNGTVTNTMLAGSIATSKITGLATSATTDTTNAANITSGTLPNARLSAVPNSALANSTISGISLGSNLNTLTLGVSGTGLSGSTTYNGSAGATFTVTSNATSANTASAIVARDASGNFSASAITATDLTLSGNLTVNGVTTTINSNTLAVDDKNIEIGSVVAISSVSGTVSGTATTTTVTGLASTSGMIPGQALTRVSGAGAFGGTTTITSVDSATQITITSTTANTAGAIVFNVSGATDTTATGGGITLKGATDKTIIWNSNGWTHSENVNIVSGKTYKINGTDVLSGTTLGSGVTGSSLTSVGTLTSGTWNASIISPTYGGTGINNGSKTITLGGNLTTSGAFATTLTVTGATSVTLPTSGTLISSTDTGTVTSAMIADGTIVNGDISATAAIAISKLAASTISGVSLGSNLNALTIGTGLSGTSYNGSAAVTIAIDSTVATLTGAQTLTNKTLTDNTTYFQDDLDNTKKLQFQLSEITTATTRTLTVPNASGTIALTSNKLSAFASTTSAELAGIVSDETGSGSLVFATSPTLTTPTLGVATATSINKVAITAPATGSTLTIADGKTLTASNTLTFTGTDASSVAFGTGGTVVYTSNKLSALAATTSAELAGVISDETGSGSLVFGTSPSITTSLITGSTSFDLINTTATTLNIGGAATSLNLGASTGTTTINNNLTVGGNLTINGTTTTLNSYTLSIDDKNIELGSVVALSNVSGTISSSSTLSLVTVATTRGLLVGQTLTKVSGTGAFGTSAVINSIVNETSFYVYATTTNTAGSIVFNVGGATDDTADGGGITLKGTTDKTFKWSPVLGWSSSEHITIASGKTLSFSTTGSSIILYGTNASNGATSLFLPNPGGSGNIITSLDTGTVTNTMLAGSIAMSKLTGTLPVANGGTGTTTSTGSGNVVLSASPTFTGTPTAPTPTTGYNNYVSDDRLATTNFVNPARSLGETGYYKLPNGLILQFGTSYIATGGTVVNFPIAFPNDFNLTLTPFYAGPVCTTLTDNTNSWFKAVNFYTTNGVGVDAYVLWVAIGF